MIKANCIIIEDEKPAREVLTSYLQRTDWLTLASVFEDALSALEYLKRNDVDLIFLDIQVPGINGIEFLRMMKEKPQVIITSAYSEYALDAFELDVRDYLKKPYTFERFLKAVNRISVEPEPHLVHRLGQTTNGEHSFAFFNVNKMMVKVLFEHIRYIESMREYIYIYHGKANVVTKMGISAIEKSLGPDFLRIHRSYIVNLNKIDAYNAEEIVVGDTSLPIGTNYKKLVLALLSKGNM